MSLKKIVRFFLIVEVLLVPLIYLPFTSNIFVFNKQVLIIVLGALSLFLYLIDAARRGKLIWRRTALDYPLLAFLFVYTLCFAFSANRWNSLFSWLSLLFLGVFYFLVNNVFKKRSVLLNYLIISGVLVSVIFLSAFFTNKLGLSMTWLKNPLANQTNLVGFLAAVIVITLIKVFNPNLKKILYKSGLLLATALFLFVILLINFRIGWICLAAGGLILLSLVLSRREKYVGSAPLLVSVLICLISLLFIFINMPNLIKTDFPAEVSLSRQASWGIAWQSAWNRVFGFGQNNFQLAFSRFKPEQFNQNALWNIRFDRAGDLFSQVLATTGWLGFLSWVAFIVLSLLITFIHGALLPGFLVLLVIAWYVPFSPSLWLLLFVLLALSAKQGRKLSYNIIKNQYGSFVTSASFIGGIILLVLFLSFVGRLYLADHYAQAGDFDKAISYNSHEPRYYLANAQKLLNKALKLAQTFDQSAGENVNQQEISWLVSRAVSQSQQATALSNEKNSAVLEARARILEQTRGLVGNADEWVIKTYEKALELEPNNPYFYQQLGLAYVRGEETDQARENFEKAIGLRPRLAVAQYELGRLLYNSGEVDSAIEHFNKAVAVNPNYSNALYSLALAYERQGQPGNALGLLERVLELNPDNSEVKNRVKQIKKQVNVQKQEQDEEKAEDSQDSGPAEEE